MNVTQRWMDGNVSKVKSKGAVVTEPVWEERGGVGQNRGRGRSLGTFSRALPNSKDGRSSK